MRTLLGLKNEELNLSLGAAEVLKHLRENVESQEGQFVPDLPAGASWWSLYLPNAGAGHSFAGHLSALKKVDLYYTYDPEGNFGCVVVYED